MSVTSSEQAKTVFLAALDRAPDQRQQYLDQTCASDHVLKDRVRKLLAAHEIADKVLPKPPGSSIGHTLDPDPPREIAGKRIGRYTLERVIAVGGMAVVYEARQENPVRSVALKVMKRAAASRSALRRFEFETQTLARLAHPNIAKIHEAGLHDDPADPADPVPYFAMELIPGARTLIEYANENALSAPARLDLLILVCDAVHHGHQKGVIHRDLKPGNILVDADGCPKIIDFGVARATDSDLTATTTQLDAGKVIGTVQYMSPEQAAGNIDDLDTRSDVYALGVVAYELLAGKLPYDLSGRLIHEAVRIIQQDQPATLGTINRTLRGDIETIVAKALEKDPARRYQSAADLARDFERYLAGEPIEAKRDSPTYVLRKLLRKHKLPVAVAAAFLIVICAGLAASLTFWQQAVGQRDTTETARLAEAEQRRIAAKRADEIEQVATFQAEMLARVNPQRMARRLHQDLLSETRSSLQRRGLPPERIEEQVRQIDDVLVGLNLTNVTLQGLDAGILKESLATIRERFASQPVVQASLLQTAAATYDRLGMFDAALPPLTEALEIRRRALGDDHPDTLKTIHQTVKLFSHMRRRADSEPYIREAYERASRTLPEDDPTRQAAIGDMAGLLERQGRSEEAEALRRQVWDAKRRLLGDDHLDTLGPLAALTSVLRAQGKNAEATPLAQQAMDLRRKALAQARGDDRLDALFELAFWLNVEGKTAEVEKYYREALELSRREFGDDHHGTNAIVNNISILLMSQRRWAEAEPFLRDALRRCRRALGEDHLDTVAVMFNLGMLLHEVKQYDEAELLLRNVVQRRRRIKGDVALETLDAMRYLARLLIAQDKLTEAESVLREAVEGAQRGLGEEHWITNSCRLHRGKTLTKLERYAESERQFLDCERYMHDSEDGVDRLDRSWLEGMATLYTDWHAAEPDAGYDAKAAEWRAKAAAAKLPAEVKNEEKPWIVGS